MDEQQLKIEWENNLKIVSLPLESFFLENLKTNINYVEKAYSKYHEKFEEKKRKLIGELKEDFYIFYEDQKIFDKQPISDFYPNSKRPNVKQISEKYTKDQDEIKKEFEF